MPILESDLKLYDCANHPENDLNPSGGAISTAGKVELANPASPDTLSIKSDGADTRNVMIYGRDSAGALVNETKQLNGVNWVEFTTVFDRINQVITTSSGSRTITVTKYTAGAHTPILATLEPTIISVKRNFIDAISSGSIQYRYEKIFYKNCSALTLSNALVKIIGDPQARIMMALAAAKDDNGTTPDGNRIGVDSKPAGLTWVDDNVSQGMPTGELAPGESIGIWLEQQLPINDPAFKNSYTLELSGSAAL